MTLARMFISKIAVTSGMLVRVVVITLMAGTTTLLYANNDSDDVRLYRSDRYAFSPQSETIRLSRCQERFVFPESIGSDDNITDDYRVFPFYLADKAILSVKAFSHNETVSGVLVPPTELISGSSYFVVTYDQVRRVIGDVSNGFVIKVYEHEDIDAESSGVIAEFPGVLTYYRAGTILGNLVQSDVNIKNGELSIYKEDFTLEGVGPYITLSRIYNRDALNN